MLNRVTLIGRVGKKPEIRFLPTGSGVSNFTMATNEYYKNREGEKQQKTVWHDITAWGNLAEFIAEYIEKGALIFVEGSLETNKWKTNEGQYRTKRYVRATRIQIILSKRTETVDDDQSGGDYEPSGDDDVPF